MLLILLAACGAVEGEAPVPEGESTGLESLRARAQVAFEVVDLFKPRSDEEQLDPYQAPILYREAVQGRERELGALSIVDGEPRLDLGRPTVYFERGRLRQGERELEQTSFLWFRGEGEGEPPVPQGLRVTRDEAGFPAVIEVLRDSSGRSLFFASRPLEERAVEGGQAVLKGARFALEPDRVERPDVALVGLYGQGPQPLGPIAYLDAERGDLFDVHCRCSPSRISDIRDTIEYELVPWSEVEAELAQESKEAWSFPAKDWPLFCLRLPGDL